MKQSLAFFFSFLFFNVAIAQGSTVAVVPTVRTELQIKSSVTSQATAGDIVVLRVFPDDLDVVPQMDEELEKGPVSWGSGRVLGWQKFQDRIEIYLTSYTPGKFEIIPVDFKKDGEVVFRSEVKSIDFASVGKAEDPIYPPMGVSFPKWIWIVLSALGLALVLGGLFALARWSQKRKVKLEEMASAPRILNALEEFEETKEKTVRKDFVSQGRYKKHYFALSDAAKRFIAKKFRFDAEESTTRELIMELETKALSKETITQWKEIFEEMDITKFTDQKPDVNQANSLPDRLSELVGTSWRQGR